MSKAARWLLATVLCGALVALGSAGRAATEAGSSEVSLVPWVPSESWPGGRQYDPRLEKTVRFWGAGMPLKDVFAGVREQTGVEIGFWPAGDVNERICVTLYLNAEQPPTLRELMAQLSWVVDCGFSHSVVDGQSVYHLMRTSIGEGVMERLREESRERGEDAAARRPQENAALKQRVLDVLEECRTAVRLPQEELLKRYRGVNDVLLVALLDPRYRPALDFVLSLPRERLEEMPLEPWAKLTWDWWELTREQRDDIRASIRPFSSASMRLGPPDPYWLAEERRESRSEGARRVFAEVGMSTHHHETAGDEITVGVRIPDPEQGGATGTEVGVPLLPHATVPATEETDVLVRSLLGESVSDEELQAAHMAYWERSSEEDRRRLQAEAARRLTEHRGLSKSREEFLASLSLPMGPDESWSLWQMQEAAAAASGLHVVSDCFWQPERSLSTILEGLPARETSRLSVLDVLTLACGSGTGREHLRPGTAEDWVPTHEWEDAGGFLRFRSVERDVWRSAVLPLEMLETATRSLEGPLAQLDGESARTREVEVRFDLREAARLAAALTEAQCNWGGKLVYGDPTDARNAYRHATLDKLLTVVSAEWHLLRALAGLSTPQWEALKGEGLSGAEIRHSWYPRSLRFDILRAVPLSDCPTPELAEWWAENWEEPPPGVDLSDYSLLYGIREDDVICWAFPNVLRVEPRSTARLVEGGGRAELE